MLLIEKLKLAPVPVGPADTVELAEYENRELTPVPVGPTTAEVLVIGAECV